METVLAGAILHALGEEFEVSAQASELIEQRQLRCPRRCGGVLGQETGERRTGWRSPQCAQAEPCMSGRSLPLPA
ncbi:MAG: hypothetical protein KF766_07660 [Rhodocyclaceae bacterium]|nr:hypothetical protein [Rhodocyclaceae bacterium]